MAKGSVSRAMKRASHYLRNDFKEIVNPSAMPNPQWYKEKAKGTRKTSILNLVKVVGTALGEYRKGWKHFLAGTSPDEARGGERAAEDGGGGESEGSAAEDVSQLASELGKRGAESAQPYLKRLYRTRMTAYRDAIKEFSIGFGEGLTQPIEENADAAKGQETRTDTSRDARAERQRGA